MPISEISEMTTLNRQFLHSGADKRRSRPLVLQSWIDDCPPTISSMADLEIISPTLQRIHQDWQNRRNGRTLPPRSSFDILDFKYILGNLNLLDVLRAWHELRIASRLRHDVEIRR